MIYPAHILYTDNKKIEIQTVEDHCLQTAYIAAMCLRDIRLDFVAYLAGKVYTGI